MLELAYTSCPIVASPAGDVGDGKSAVLKWRDSAGKPRSRTYNTEGFAGMVLYYMLDRCKCDESAAGSREVGRVCPKCGLLKKGKSGWPLVRVRPQHSFPGMGDGIVTSTTESRRVGVVSRCGRAAPLQVPKEWSPPAAQWCGKIVPWATPMGWQDYVYEEDNSCLERAFVNAYTLGTSFVGVGLWRSTAVERSLNECKFIRVKAPEWLTDPNLDKRRASRGMVIRSYELTQAPNTAKDSMYDVLRDVYLDCLKVRAVGEAAEGNEWETFAKWGFLQLAVPKVQDSLYLRSRKEEDITAVLQGCEFAWGGAKDGPWPHEERGGDARRASGIRQARVCTGPPPGEKEDRREGRGGTQPGLLHSGFAQPARRSRGRGRGRRSRACRQ